MGLNISGLCSKTGQEPVRKEEGVSEESSLAWGARSSGSKHVPLRPCPRLVAAGDLLPGQARGG